MVAEFENLLKRAIGLDALSMGPSAIARAVQQRLAVCEANNYHDYWKRVTTSDSELQELIEAIVVSETWFFRDREAFAALGKVAFEEWLPAHSQGAMRILSVPCATGEEPYSIVMALLDAGLPALCFRVDAVDISAQALKRAQEAVYGKNSFRGQHIGFRDRYFSAGPNGYSPSNQVRERVIFHRGNLLDADFLATQGPYDFIFCRNLLIYFDRATQNAAIKVLRRLLSDKGLLFVAPAEASLVIAQGFISAKLPLAFAFRKAAAPAAAHSAGRPHLRKSRVTLPRHAPVKRDRTHETQSTERERPPIANLPTIKSPPDLEVAARLADQGCLTEASAFLEEHLRLHGPSAKACYLLGLVRDAKGHHVEAAEWYRKTLYLEPNHCEALMHLAGLTEKTGDKAAVQILRNRARRATERAQNE